MSDDSDDDYMSDKLLENWLVQAHSIISILISELF